MLPHAVPEHDLGQQGESQTLGQKSTAWVVNAGQGCKTHFFHGAVSCFRRASPGCFQQPAHAWESQLGWYSSKCAKPTPVRTLGLVQTRRTWGRHCAAWLLHFKCYCILKKHLLRQYVFQHRMQKFCLWADFHYHSPFYLNAPCPKFSFGVWSSICLVPVQGWTVHGMWKLLENSLQLFLRYSSVKQCPPHLPCSYTLFSI